MKTVTDFNKVFKYKSDSVDSWRNLAKAKEPKGDCDDYAWTVACIMERNPVIRFIKLLKGEIKFIHCYTRWGEPHMIFWHEDHGYIDNIYQRWLKNKPHERHSKVPLVRVAFKVLLGFVAR